MTPADWILVVLSGAVMAVTFGTGIYYLCKAIQEYYRTR